MLSSIYLVTFPLMKRFLLTILGVIQSLLGILRKYLRYTIVTPEVTSTPEANAVAVWYSGGIPFRDWVTRSQFQRPPPVFSVLEENICFWKQESAVSTVAVKAKLHTQSLANMHFKCGWSAQVPVQPKRSLPLFIGLYDFRRKPISKRYPFLHHDIAVFLLFVNHN